MKKTVNKTLLSLSSNYIYTHNEKPTPISKHHSPYLLAYTSNGKDIEPARKKLVEKTKKTKKNDDVFSKISKIGETEKYNSFWNFNKQKKVFKVYTKKSYFVPDVSSELFFNHNIYTAEHDIPYHQRALADLAAENKAWIFDTEKKDKNLKVLVYDIETTQYEQGDTNVPIDIIGFSSFNIKINSQKNLENENFDFNIIDQPESWTESKVEQYVSNNIDEEIKNLFKFCKKVTNCDIVSGHNIIGFDNLQIYHRIKWILKKMNRNLSKEKKVFFKKFLEKYCRLDKSFYYGLRGDVVEFHPCSLDTYLACRKFYSNLDSYSLKNLAPFLGICIDDRLVLKPSEIKIDDQTLRYNKQDVQEQLGVTLSLIQQSLPLAFTTCMPFQMLFSSGAVNMWDHMAMIRAKHQKKIMPPIVNVKSTCKRLTRDFKECNSKKEIISKSKKNKEQLSKGFERVVKYGDEMPSWMEHPEVIYNVDADSKDEEINYHMPGGMTIKPDRDADSHFIPWWRVVIADVGAMYPTILKAMNIGADTVRLCKKDEKPDEWIWLKKISQSFLDKNDFKFRKATSEDEFADKGYMLAVKIDDKNGVVNKAMTGILNMISKIKKELNEMKKDEENNDLKRMKMMYQSIKGARNAGTHGILSAPNVPGRQFNLWGAATITTKGQHILSDTLNYLQDKNIRVVYGDTDGIYMGCSRSMGDVSGFAESLGIDVDDISDKWITKPNEALEAIKQCNQKWRKSLNYEDFELEP
ncbi:MAG: DNA polymerase domain-containing protein, partial [Candidatus Thermoplasmatota archaeon]